MKLKTALITTPINLGGITITIVMLLSILIPLQDRVFTMIFIGLIHTVIDHGGDLVTLIIGILMTITTIITQDFTILTFLTTVYLITITTVLIDTTTTVIIDLEEEPITTEDIENQLTQEEV